MDPLPTGKPDRVLQIVGSAGLRQGSFDRALLRAALAPSSLRITAHDLLPIPLYDADVEARGAPEVVTDLRNVMAGRRPADRDAGVQLRDPRGSQERDRLDVEAA